MKLSHFMTVWAAANMMVACNSPSEPYKAETKVVHYEQFKAGEFKADGLNINIDKRVDILFVIDDSFSMDAHQKELTANLDRFVDGLASKNKDIDFHIGVTAVWDNYRYLSDDSVVPRVCKFEDGTERLQWEENGSLKPLKGDASFIAKANGARFVTNTDGYKEVLRQTLKIGAQPFVKTTSVDSKTGKTVCAVGPQYEDLFSPMIEALRPSGPRVNAGFRREGAFLVVILVTDAKDGSQLNAEQAYEQLKSLTGVTAEGKPKLRVFAVAMNAGDVMKKGSCNPDPAFGTQDPKTDRVKIPWGTRAPDHEVLKLARLTSDDNDDSQILSICSNFGSALSNFSSKIINDVVPDLRVPMPKLVDRSKKLELSIAGEPLVENQHWVYNPESNILTIRSGKVDWSKYKGQQIHVGLTPVVDPLADSTLTH